jgi:hypothetical protein
MSWLVCSSVEGAAGESGRILAPLGGSRGWRKRSHVGPSLAPPKGGGSFASANRFALLSWLVCSSVEEVAKDYSKQLPRGWELCFGESVCSFVLVGLLFCGGGG